MYAPPFQTPRNFASVKDYGECVDDENGQGEVKYFVCLFDNKSLSYDYRYDIDHVCSDCEKTIVLD